MSVDRKPGLHPGVPFAEYLRLDAVNNSTLRHFQRTAAHAHHALTHPDVDTEALRVGNAAHVAILEPDRFETEYVKAPKFDKRTNVGKASAAQWMLDHPTQAALLPDEWDLAVAMRDAVWAHPTAKQLLSGPGENEMTGLWNDETTGLLCKCRPDRLTTYHDWSVVLDLKTAQDASPDGFSRACAKFLYHWQASLYLDGLNVIAPPDRRFVHVVVEKSEPHAVALYEMDEPTLEEGGRQVRRALNLWAECKRTGIYPGYSAGIEVLNLPRWSFELTSPEF